MRRRDLEHGNPRKYGDRREKALASTGQYRRTPGSGSSGVKGDLRRADLMVEVKSTRHDSFRVDANIMAKLKNDGLTNGLEGMLIVEIGTGERFAVLNLSTFERLVPLEES